MISSLFSYSTIISSAEAESVVNGVSSLIGKTDSRNLMSSKTCSSIDFGFWVVVAGFWVVVARTAMGSKVSFVRIVSSLIGKADSRNLI